MISSTKQLVKHTTKLRKKRSLNTLDRTSTSQLVSHHRIISELSQLFLVKPVPAASMTHWLWMINVDLVYLKHNLAVSASITSVEVEFFCVWTVSSCSVNLIYEFDNWHNHNHCNCKTTMHTHTLQLIIIIIIHRHALTPHPPPPKKKQTKKQKTWQMGKSNIKKKKKRGGKRKFGKTSLCPPH